MTIPSFGDKAHTGSDKRFRFIRRWDVPGAAAHAGRMRRRGFLDKSGSGVWTDRGYRSKQNEACMSRHGFTGHVYHRKPKGRLMPAPIKRGNNTRSRHRAPIEHGDAVEKNVCGLPRRTIRVARATTKSGLANSTGTIFNIVHREPLGRSPHHTKRLYFSKHFKLWDRPSGIMLNADLSLVSCGAS